MIAQDVQRTLRGKAENRKSSNRDRPRLHVISGCLPEGSHWLAASGVVPRVVSDWWNKRTDYFRECTVNCSPHPPLVSNAKKNKCVARAEERAKPSASGRGGQAVPEEKKFCVTDRSLKKPALIYSRLRPKCVDNSCKTSSDVLPGSLGESQRKIETSIRAGDITSHRQ